MLKVYGISNCDKVKKTLNKLKESGIDFEFYNFKKQAPMVKHIQNWKKEFGDWPINKRGTTYRKLKSDFEDLSAKDKALFICSNSSMIIRPIFEVHDKLIMIGLDEGFIDKIQKSL